MFRKIITLLLCLSLSLTTIACSSGPSNQVQQTSSNKPAVLNNQLEDGKYPVQQASYDDVDGIYTLMLLNTPAGKPPIYQTANLQMARLSEEAIANGEKTYLEMNNNQPVMYLTEDFKIEYYHNVAETQTNPQTGQQETVIVRRESNFWSPFAGALAGQVVGNLLFAPRYYVPPVYTPGRPLTGYGGVGTSFDGAVQNYQSNHNSPPPVVKNRQVLRTSGTAKRTPTTTTTRTNSGTKSSGSGFGSSDLNTPRKTNTPTSTTRPRSGSFGSSGTRRAPVRSRRR
ncbi:MAG: hypothetical protein EA365_05035 [Gloeocapsa sp. DLM2.Bin57]|nr:MAG: hypothetical protein EA365_05035 [Gloeocapsa sp. DLM2.Bin57]